MLGIDFTNYSRLQASRLTVTSRSALRAKIEHEMQAYLQAGGQITTLPCETKTAPHRPRTQPDCETAEMTGLTPGALPLDILPEVIRAAAERLGGKR